jgi:hypothetical protein
MRERCWSPAHPYYSKVGGRGIRVCSKWGEFHRFHAWAMRSGYRPGLCLSRVDRKGSYAPANCQWFTRPRLMERFSPTISRKPRWTIAAFGERKGPRAWSRDPRCTVSLSGLLHRLRLLGFPPEDAITLPPRTPGHTEPVVWVSAFGQTKGAEDWARDRRCRVGPGSLRARLRRSVPPEVAITAPPFQVKARRNRVGRRGSARSR